MSFKKFDKLDLKDLNLAEAKGWVIGQLNNIEMLIGYIIINYFKPSREKEKDFKNTLLNSSITSFASKVKVLKGLGIINAELHQNLMQLSSIRNSFAHTPITHHYTMYATHEPGAAKNSEVKQSMDVMMADGTIKRKETKTYFKQFEVLSLKAIEQLKLISRK